MAEEYGYEPIDFSLPSGGGGGFTGTGGIGFRANLPDVAVDSSFQQPIDYSNLFSGAGRQGFQLPAAPGTLPSGYDFGTQPVNIPQFIPQGRTADAYTGAGFRLPQLAPGVVQAATGAVPALGGEPGEGLGAAFEQIGQQVGPQIIPPEPNLLQRTQRFANENPLLMRLLGGVGTAGLGAIMGGRGQQAATNLQKDLGKLGATQRAEGQRLVAAAQRGELTAPQMQQLEAFKAQQAQALASRGLTGGTAEQQLEGQVENMRQQLLAQNLQQGLALLQIGDQYTQQAVTAGYNASQNAQNAANNFYMQALRTFAGQSNQVPYTIVPATQAPAAPAPVGL